MSKKQFYVICLLLFIIIILLVHSISQYNLIIEMITNNADHLSKKIDILSSRVIGLYEFFK